VRKLSPPRPNLNHLGLSNQFNSTAAQLTTVNAQDLLDKIKNHVKTHQLRVGEYFKDYDPLRKGIIATNKFRGVLSKMKIELNEHELKALENVFIYSTNEWPHKVDYARFVDEVDLVFTKPGLEKDPLIKVQEFAPPPYLDPQSILNPIEEERLHHFLINLGAAVFKNRILIKPFF